VNQTLERPMPIRELYIKTNAVKAYCQKQDDGANKYYLEGVASSTAQDRMGDIITLACQQKMLTQVRGMTVFLNHEYEIPESIFGTCEESRLEPGTEKGDPVFDLIIRVLCHTDNERVMRTWTAVKQGVKLGFSIGGAIPPDGASPINKKDPFGGWEITDIELYEVSCVGIPAQQRAQVDDALLTSIEKSLTPRKEQFADQASALEKRRRHKQEEQPNSAADFGEQQDPGENIPPSPLEPQSTDVEEVSVHEPGDSPGTQAGATDLPPEAPGPPSQPSGEASADDARFIRAKNDDGDDDDQPDDKKTRAQRCYEALKMAQDHGACGTVAQCIDKACKELTDGGEQELGKAIDTMHGSLKKVEGEVMARFDELKHITNQVAERQNELKALEEKIAEAKATSLGRRTSATVGQTNDKTDDPSMSTADKIALKLRAGPQN
jgi:hypothetical protein